MKECYHTAPMHLRCQLQPSSINAHIGFQYLLRENSNLHVHLRFLHTIGKKCNADQLYLNKVLVKTNGIMLNENKRCCRFAATILACFSQVHSNLFDRLASLQNLSQQTCTKIIFWKQLNLADDLCQFALQQNDGHSFFGMSSLHVH